MSLRVALTKEAMDWLEALIEKGLFIVDAQGKGSFSPPMKNIIRAMHETLTGGQVEMIITQPGTETMRVELDYKLEQAVNSMNNVNTPTSKDLFTP
jgi:hypothetical protein